MDLITYFVGMKHLELSSAHLVLYGVKTGNRRAVEMGVRCIINNLPTALPD